MGTEKQGVELRIKETPVSSRVPVLMQVRRPDGSQEFVRVGTARREGSGLVLDLATLRLNPNGTVEPGPVTPAAAKPAALPPRPPVAGTLEDLEYIASRARKTLADPSKARWHAQEREILRQAELELTRLLTKARAS
jgi:hypothetical protein